MALQRFAEEMRRAGLDPRHPRSGNNDGIPISAGRRQDYHFVSASTHSDKRPFNFTLTTDAGDLDILGEITGGGYSELLPYTITLRSFGIECRCLGLRRLIQVERASGRAKDWEAIAELEALAEESPPHPNTL